MFPRTLWSLALVASLALAACARRTQEIEATPADPALFAGASCAELVAERAKRSEKLIFSGLAQDQVSADDRMRTLGVPTPVGTIFDGDREPDVARLKGELHALEAALVAARCGADYR
jgi:hypothetical protein